MNNSLFALLVILTCTINLGNFYVIRYDGGGTFDYTYNGLGNYEYKVDLPDQKREEHGTVEGSKAGEDSYRVEGEYSFSSGGKVYKVSYVADANGYRTRTEDGVSYNRAKQPLPPTTRRLQPPINQYLPPTTRRPSITYPTTTKPPTKAPTTPEVPVNPHALDTFIGARSKG